MLVAPLLTRRILRIPVLSCRSLSAMAAAVTKKTNKAAMSTQEVIDSFWQANLEPEKSTIKPLTVLPTRVFAQLVGDRMPQGEVQGQSVAVSYAAAVKECEVKVAAIVAEAKRNNVKYTDPHFDLDDMDYCLNPLSTTTATPSSDAPTEDNVTVEVKQTVSSTGKPITWGNVQLKSKDVSAAGNSMPACAKRVGDIFDDPQFYVQRDAHVKDIRQGAEGDCWFISSLGCLTVDEQFPRLVEKLCPKKARNEKVGVYGFVFFRDGEWISEVIDDKLYLRAPDYDDCDDDRRTVWDRSHSRLEPEVSREEYRKTFQSGSDALFFGSCASQNETWVPLIEKAFAKAHGDFEAIDGGWPGEGVEDLTGGVTTEIVSADILDKDAFWNEGFMQVNKSFIFSAGTTEYGHPDPDELGRQGIEDGHAYSLLRAAQYDGNRLCLVKNPWGETEWNGPWSDGSKEWTPEALKALNHKFGNEGIFWMPYADFLRRYVQIWRTRLFNDHWKVAQHWTTIQVPWAGDYNDTKFEFDIPKATTAVIVLSQIDSRYFGGLTGQYYFQLAFRLHKSGETVHVARGYSSGDRSATTEVKLDAGTYEVFLQISGQRDTTLPKIEDVIKQNWLDRRDKLMRIGFSYDLANAKGKPAATAAKNGDSGSTGILTPQLSVQSKPGDPDCGKTVLGIASESVADTTAAKKPADDPWSAVCVLGLRVYTHTTSATIRVVKQEEQNGKKVKTRLDIDDAEKDATKSI